MPLLFSTTINISQPAARPAYRLSGILPSAKGSLCGPAHRKRGRREAAALPQHILCEDGTSRQPLSGLPHCMNARASVPAVHTSAVLSSAGMSTALPPFSALSRCRRKALIPLGMKLPAASCRDLNPLWD